LYTRNEPNNFRFSRTWVKVGFVSPPRKNEEEVLLKVCHWVIGCADCESELTSNFINFESRIRIRIQFRN